MSTTSFMVILRVLDASAGVQRRNIFFVCGQLCQSSTRYIISTEHKIYALSIRLQKHGAFQKDYIWLDTEKDFSFYSYACVDSEFATCHYQLRLVVWCMRVVAVWGGKGGRDRWMWLWTSLEFCQSPCYLWNWWISGYNGTRNWCCSVRFWTELLSITDFFRKKEVIFTQILTLLFVY